MLHTDFLEKYGSITLLAEQNSYFAQLCHPVYENGRWQKKTGRSQPIFDRPFPNIGYFRHDQKTGQNNIAGKHSTQAYTVGFTRFYFLRQYAGQRSITRYNE